MRRCLPIVAAFALLWMILPRTSRADEFKLKDGSIIIGTVVGYEGNSFKVKTSYGYALVDKDKIVSIKIASAPDSASEKKSKTDSPKSPTAENGNAVKHAKPADPAPEPKPENAAVKNSSAPAVSAARADSVPDRAEPAAAAENASTNAQPATTVASPPSAPPEPQPIREKISGNTYINDTYEFEMYKPPDWQVMDGARSVLPGAVAAMGTDDQSTYLVVGQEASGKSAAADVAATEKRLSDILVNFRPLDDEHLTVSGVQVVARRFRGNVDEHDWSGFMVFMPRGDKLYTIFGMTRADNDLVQIQENVIRRTIASFQFLPQ